MEKNEKDGRNQNQTGQQPNKQSQQGNKPNEVGKQSNQKAEEGTGSSTKKSSTPSQTSQKSSKSQDEDSRNRNAKSDGKKTGGADMMDNEEDTDSTYGETSPKISRKNMPDETNGMRKVGDFPSQDRNEKTGK